MPLAATQPVIPDADADPELLRRLVDVFADLAAEGDRDEVVAVDAVDPHVVVVDELVELGRDGHARSRGRWSGGSAGCRAAGSTGAGRPR